MNATETPTVTVIIATYNKKRLLHYTIESVLWQTFADFECWVIGDCCTDGSEEVVASFDDPRLKWTNLATNSGYQSEPNNEGLRRAQGKYIAYLNDDDLWLPNHLQELVDRLEQSAADFVYSMMEWVRSEQSQLIEVPKYPDATQPPEASAVMHRRDVVDRIGYWKKPSEVHAFPRVDFFRRAQFSDHIFVLVPYLTSIRFSRNMADDGQTSLQELYMDKIRNDGEFVEKELAGLLVDAYHKLEGPISLAQLRLQFAHTVRRKMIKRNMDPGRLLFWKRRGQRIEEWQESRELDMT